MIRVVVSASAAIIAILLAVVAFFIIRQGNHSGALCLTGALVAAFVSGGAICTWFEGLFEFFTKFPWGKP